MADAIPGLLRNDFGAATDLYSLHTGRAVDGGTLVARIRRHDAPGPETAIVSLFARFLDHSGLLPAGKTLTGPAFYALLRAEQVLPAPTGNHADLSGIRSFCNAMWDDVSASANKEVTVNGLVQTGLPNRPTDNMISAISYADAWNEKLFFIETVDSWWLLAWMTDV
jgi:hypothetical protein